MSRFFSSIIRSSAFLRKEIFAVLRQPRLLLTLVLGPFLILLIFGIGYQNEPRELRTLFVASPDSPLAQDIHEYADSLGPQLIYRGVVATEHEALEHLRRGDVDVVAVAPIGAYESIRNNQPAVFKLYHHEIDPFQVDYVNYFGQVYIDEVNRRVLIGITQEGQSDAEQVRADVAAAREDAAALRIALEAANQVDASRERVELSRNLSAVSLAVGASLGLLSGVEQTLGTGDDETEASRLLGLLTGAQEKTEQVDTSGQNSSAELQRVSEIERDLAELEENLAEFTNIDPNVLVRPFHSETASIAAVQPDPSNYFAPAVIALLLQHLAVTFAALSIVHERTVGTMELFRVSPLSAAETLVGKYISYFIFGALIVAMLTLVLIFILQVPMLGDWWHYVAVVAALLFTSLGFGFIISLISQTESQAVQYTMIMLLTSVFFSGFLMALDMIWEPVQILSWSLPTTYGIVLLRDIFLRGNPADPILLSGLTAIGLFLALLAWLLMRRQMSSK
jgi:ABC-2 type transport system permease protein